MKLLWNSFTFVLGLCAKSLKKSGNLQTILPYQIWIITILVINILSKVFLDLEYQGFQFVFIPVIIDPQKPRGVIIVIHQ